MTHGVTRHAVFHWINCHCGQGETLHVINLVSNTAKGVLELITYFIFAYPFTDKTPVLLPHVCMSIYLLLLLQYTFTTTSEVKGYRRNTLIQSSKEE